ncbi:monooxygenase, partial [Streptomyces sp. SID10116]|nr:monooxygenase [Streptomyces sp. SID10116]
VQVVTATAKPAEGTTDALTGLDALLIRPDGHVAWTSHGTPDGLTTALTHWFGPERAA